MSGPSRADFDSWYADMDDTPERDALKQVQLGLPPEVESTSLLSYAALLELRDRLALGGESTLLDIGCGRGGYAMWFAEQTGARVIGVDFSSVAVQQASAAAQARGLGARCEFRVGELLATGLGDGSVDALVCVDAFQFAGDHVAAAKELRRVLRPGGLALITTWEALDRADERVPERIRAVHLERQLGEAGFGEVAVEEHPDWRAAELAYWQAAAALDPGDSPGLRSLHEEATERLPVLPLTRRVLACGRAPAG